MFLFLFISFVFSTVPDVCKREGLVALCYDGGPSSNTNELLSILKEKGVKATFHVDINLIRDVEVQKRVKNISREGHIIGMMYTKGLDKRLTGDEMRNEITTMRNYFKDITGELPIYARLPHHNYTDVEKNAIFSAGMILSEYSVDSKDYEKIEQSLIVKNVTEPMMLNNAKLNSWIVVQRDSVKESVKATPEIIDNIRKYNYSLCRLDQCIGDVEFKEQKSTSNTNEQKEQKEPNEDVKEEKTGEKTVSSGKFLSYGLCLFISYFVLFLIS